MQTTHVGKSGLKVSRFCLGTMTYGTQITEAEAIKVIDSALDAGINFLDTANGYAEGKSEEIIGKALKGKRSSVVIATKVGAPTKMGGELDLSRRNIISELEGSLKRLQTDYVDIYYCHAPDINTPLEETLRALDDMVQQGKVRYIGCSNFRSWRLCKALWISDRYNLANFVCVEPPYSLLIRDIEEELVPLCETEGLGICVFNPLAGELLTGRHEFGKAPKEGRFTLKDLGPGYLDRYWNANNFEAVETLKKIAVRNGISLAQFSLAWILHNPAITSILSGVINPEQLKENIGALDVKLSEEDLAECDNVWHMLRPPRFTYGK
jgi:aryl-alcohol dehydrogenase-like predicted oxidoreductase